MVTTVTALLIAGGDANVYRHDLTTKEKKAWIAGVKCMQRTPGVYKNVHDIEHLTAHEDYTYQHKTQSTYVHWNVRRPLPLPLYIH